MHSSFRLADTTIYKTSPFSLKQRISYTKKIDCFCNVSIIGKGSQGTVTIGTFRDGKVCAIKKVIINPKQKNREAEILIHLHHPNIISLYGVTRTLGRYVSEIIERIYLELMPETLNSAISRKEPHGGMTIDEIWTCSYQLLSALSYLQDNCIIHRDIKPSNILVDTGTWTVKLCDFGSAKYFVKDEPSVNYIASRPYRAPELLLEKTNYDYSVDIWAAGCVIGEMFRGRPLFYGASTFGQIREIAKIIGSIQPESDDDSSTEPLGLQSLFSRHVPSEFMTLMNRMLDPNPLTRITAKEALQLPLFTDPHFNSVYI